MKNIRIAFVVIMLCTLIFSGCDKIETTNLCEKYISAVVEIQVRDDNEQICR